MESIILMAAEAAKAAANFAGEAWLLLLALLGFGVPEDTTGWFGWFGVPKDTTGWFGVPEDTTGWFGATIHSAITYIADGNLLSAFQSIEAEGAAGVAAAFIGKVTSALPALGFEAAEYATATIYNVAEYVADGSLFSMFQTKGAAVVISGVAGAAAAIGAPIALLSVLGFNAAGIAAGSIAATIQSALGYVGAGSLFSICQSAGAAGFAFVTNAVLGAAGAASGAATAWFLW